MYLKANYLLRHPFVKFALVGGASTLCQFLALMLLVEVLHLNPVVASASSYLCGAICNYLLNYYFTFKVERSRHIYAIPKFMLVVLIGLGVNTASFTLFLALLDLYLLAQLAAVFVTLIVNYLLHRYWIYPAPAQPSESRLNEQYEARN